jgi:hypothetical protein
LNDEFEWVYWSSHGGCEYTYRQRLVTID